MRSSTIDMLVLALGLLVIAALALAPTPRCDTWGRGLLGGCPVQGEGK